MGLITVKAIASLEGSGKASAVPTEFTLLKSGLNSYVGDELLFDSEAAQSVMAVYQKRGIDLMADYEHQSLVHPPIEAPASAKKWTPELRNGDLVAASIAWTPRASKMIADGEYRYFSIACRVDEKTRRVVEVINFGLTNNPAANQIAPIKAASIAGAQRQESKMKTVLVALGLSADLEESVAVAEAAKVAEFKRDVLTMTGKGTIPEALGVLRAQANSHEQVVALTAQVAAANAEKRGLEFDALVKAGDSAKQITPAMAKDWIPSLRGREDGVEILKSFLASAPAQVQALADAPQEMVQDDAAPSADEIAVARAFVGTDPDAISKRIAEVRALNTKRKV